jgi:hypothetical protein
MPVPVIGGAALRAALDEIFLVFGGVGRLYALSDLEGQGIRFDDCSMYTLEQLKKALSVMGPEVTDMVTERLRRKMAAPDR